MRTDYVTAGAPAVTSQIRQRRMVQERTRHLSNLELAEQAERDSVTVAPDGDIDTTNGAAQVGRSMTSDQVKKRLLKCNGNFWFEISAADSSKIGIYVIENRPDTLGIMQKDKRFVVGMQNGWMPEFSIRHFKEKQVPAGDNVNWETKKEFARETRGWRTVLARLLKERLITAPQIEAYFKVSQGRSSQMWQAITT